MADMALEEASDAHLIIFAAHLSGSIPNWLLNWLEQWAMQRQVHDAALAVTEESQGKIILAKATSELHQFAKQHRLFFMFDDNNVDVTQPEIIAYNLFKHETLISSARPNRINASIQESHQGWGINE
jgi:hypothetical protein